MKKHNKNAGRLVTDGHPQKAVHRHGDKANPGTNGNAGRRNRIVQGLFIALTGFLLYSNSVQNDFALDDYSVIKKNWVVRQGTAAFPTILSTSYRFGYRDAGDELYRPLPLMIFATLWQLFPDNPVPFHLLNVLLYAFTGFLLYSVLCKLFSNINPLLPFIAALLFIVHPLHTEVVANIKSIDEILSFMFVILCLRALLDYINKGTKVKLIVAWLFFLLAFFSKEGTIVMLVLIPLTLLMFTDVSRQKVILISGVLLSASIIFLVVRARVLGGFTAGKVFMVQENVLVSAPDIGIRLATVFQVLFLYLRLLFIPYPLSSDYSYKQLNLASWSEPLPWVSLILYGLLAFIAFRTFSKNRLVSFGILFFFGTIALYSNLVITIGSLFAERFLYAAILGFSVVVAWLLFLAFKIPLTPDAQKHNEKIFHPGNNKILLVVAVLVFPCSLITLSRNKDWKDTATLFSKDVIKSPNSALLHFNYANVLKAEKAVTETDQDAKNRLLDSAIVHYQTALELYPQFNEVYEQLGLACFYRGLDSMAFFYVSKAIELDPWRSTAYNSLGTIYFTNFKNYRKALELYLHAVEINPNYIDGWRNVGASYGSLGEYENAIDAFKQVLRLDPRNATVLKFMAQTYQALGDEQLSRSYSQKAAAAEGIVR